MTWILTGEDMDKAELIKILDDHRQFIVTIGVYGKESHLHGIDFQDIDLQDVDLSWANLEGVVNLTAEQLCTAKSLYKARLSPELEKKVREKCPELYRERLGAI